MSKRRLALAGALLLVATFGLLLSAAASGRSTTVLTDPACNTTVTTNVTLAASMDCRSSAQNVTGTALIVGKSGITINLNGHTINAYSTSYDCIDNEGGYSKVTITNGTLNNCYDGVYLDDASSTTISKITSANSVYGVYAYYSAGTAVTSLTATNPASGGWYCDEYCAGDKITSSTVTLSGSSNAYGFYSYESTAEAFSKDTVSGGTNSYQFYDEYSNLDTYTGNKASSGEYGFYLDCVDEGVVTVSANSAMHESSDGFNIDDCYNDGVGYESGAPQPSTIVSNNTADFNGSYGINDDYNPGIKVTGNTASSNSSDGFYDDGSPLAIYTGNKALSNSSDGFYFYDNYYEYAALSIKGNSASNNSGYGFDTDYSVAGSGLTGSNNNNGICYRTAGCTGS